MSTFIIGKVTFRKQLNGWKDIWSQRLDENPTSYGKIEVEVHLQFRDFSLDATPKNLESGETTLISG